jgi:hypothetical protein
MALEAADAGNAGHWPTVAGILAEAYRAKQQGIAEKIADAILTNGFGETAIRIDLRQRRPGGIILDERSLGGLGRESLVKTIKTVLDSCNT